ncbi:hypothetical protein GCM10010344_12210 [Streptomyces bluensis]|nr:hypothetical protein GCM10010344_12210 [Streptomyces bluensis]
MIVDSRATTGRRASSTSLTSSDTTSTTCLPPVSRFSLISGGRCARSNPCGLIAAVARCQGAAPATSQDTDTGKKILGRKRSTAADGGYR